MPYAKQDFLAKLAKILPPKKYCPQAHPAAAAVWDDECGVCVTPDGKPTGARVTCMQLFKSLQRIANQGYASFASPTVSNISLPRRRQAILFEPSSSAERACHARPRRHLAAIDSGRLGCSTTAS
jgi:hypothetical protein